MIDRERIARLVSLGRHWQVEVPLEQMDFGIADAVLALVGPTIDNLEFAVHTNKDLHDLVQAERDRLREQVRVLREALEELIFAYEQGGLNEHAEARFSDRVIDARDALARTEPQP